MLYEEVCLSSWIDFQKISIGPHRRCIKLFLLIRAIKKCLSFYLFFTLIFIINSIVCIAGAGRGPLVTRCLKALDRANREAAVLVVEKNPNAFVTCVHHFVMSRNMRIDSSVRRLQQRQAMDWGEKVQLIFGDMRVIDVPEKADILVSELLGSFGDNELSPECLDGASRFLKGSDTLSLVIAQLIQNCLVLFLSETGISIPSSYTAHLAPLSSSKLYNEARSTKDEKSLETPYVVMFQAVNILSGTKAISDERCGPQTQECWEFEHPRRDAVLDSRGGMF